nr:hypothetical protein [uncultured bacterium]
MLLLPGDLQSSQGAMFQSNESCLRRKDLLLDAAAVGLRERKFHQEAQAAQKCRLEGWFTVRRKNSQTPVVFHPLEEADDLDVGVAVVAVPDLGALFKQGTCLDEREDGAALLCSIEDLFEVLLRLPDLLGHHTREINAVEVQVQVI